jgi:putative ABC transport system substrate-binding protein
VDVIVTAGPADTRAAKRATSTIPIVMTFDNDPVGNGFAASLARPGGNITGLSNVAPELSGKRLELLKEIVPRLSQVAVLE